MIKNIDHVAKSTESQGHSRILKGQHKTQPTVKGHYVMSTDEISRTVGYYINIGVLSLLVRFPAVNILLGLGLEYYMIMSKSTVINFLLTKL